MEPKIKEEIKFRDKNDESKHSILMKNTKLKDLRNLQQFDKDFDNLEKTLNAMLKVMPEERNEFHLPGTTKVKNESVSKKSVSCFKKSFSSVKICKETEKIHSGYKPIYNYKLFQKTEISKDLSSLPPKSDLSTNRQIYASRSGFEAENEDIVGNKLLRNDNCSSEFSKQPQKAQCCRNKEEEIKYEATHVMQTRSGVNKEKSFSNADQDGTKIVIKREPATENHYHYENLPDEIKTETITGKKTILPTSSKVSPKPKPELKEELGRKETAQFSGVAEHFEQTLEKDDKNNQHQKLFETIETFTKISPNETKYNLRQKTIMQKAQSNICRTLDVTESSVSKKSDSEHKAGFQVKRKREKLCVSSSNVFTEVQDKFPNKDGSSDLHPKETSTSKNFPIKEISEITQKSYCNEDACVNSSSMNERTVKKMKMVNRETNYVSVTEESFMKEEPSSNSETPILRNSPMKSLLLPTIQNAFQVVNSSNTSIRGYTIDRSKAFDHSIIKQESNNDSKDLLVNNIVEESTANEKSITTKQKSKESSQESRHHIKCGNHEREKVDLLHKTRKLKSKKDAITKMIPKCKNETIPVEQKSMETLPKGQSKLSLNDGNEDKKDLVISENLLCNRVHIHHLTNSNIKSVNTEASGKKYVSNSKILKETDDDRKRLVNADVDQREGGEYAEHMSISIKQEQKENAKTSLDPILNECCRNKIVLESKPLYISKSKENVLLDDCRLTSNVNAIFKDLSGTLESITDTTSKRSHISGNYTDRSNSSIHPLNALNSGENRSFERREIQVSDRVKDVETISLNLKLTQNISQSTQLRSKEDVSPQGQLIEASLKKSGIQDLTYLHCTDQEEIDAAMTVDGISSSIGKLPPVPQHQKMLEAHSQEQEVILLSEDEDDIIHLATIQQSNNNIENLQLPEESLASADGDVVMIKIVKNQKNSRYDRNKPADETKVYSYFPEIIVTTSSDLQETSLESQVTVKNKLVKNNSSSSDNSAHHDLLKNGEEVDIEVEEEGLAVHNSKQCPSTFKSCETTSEEEMTLDPSKILVYKSYLGTKVDRVEKDIKFEKGLAVHSSKQCSSTFKSCETTSEEEITLDPSKILVYKSYLDTKVDRVEKDVKFEKGLAVHCSKQCPSTFKSCETTSEEEMTLDPSKILVYKSYLDTKENGVQKENSEREKLHEATEGPSSPNKSDPLTRREVSQCCCEADCKDIKLESNVEYVSGSMKVNDPIEIKQDLENNCNLSSSCSDVQPSTSAEKQRESKVDASKTPYKEDCQRINVIRPSNCERTSYTNRKRKNIPAYEASRNEPRFPYNPHRINQRHMNQNYINHQRINQMGNDWNTCASEVWAAAQFTSYYEHLMQRSTTFQSQFGTQANDGWVGPRYSPSFNWEQFNHYDRTYYNHWNTGTWNIPSSSPTEQFWPHQFPQNVNYSVDHHHASSPNYRPYQRRPAYQGRQKRYWHQNSQSNIPYGRQATGTIHQSNVEKLKDLNKTQEKEKNNFHDKKKNLEVAENFCHNAHDPKFVKDESKFELAVKVEPNTNTELNESSETSISRAPSASKSFLQDVKVKPEERTGMTYANIEGNASVHSSEMNSLSTTVSQSSSSINRWKESNPITDIEPREKKENSLFSGSSNQNERSNHKIDHNSVYVKKEQTDRFGNVQVKKEPLDYHQEEIDFDWRNVRIKKEPVDNLNDYKSVYVKKENLYCFNNVKVKKERIDCFSSEQQDS